MYNVPGYVGISTTYNVLRQLCQLYNYYIIQVARAAPLPYY